MSNDASSPRSAVIVGAGQAGAWVARTLRQEGFAGRVLLIGAEAHLPYERPPLSKGILNGKEDVSKAYLMTEAELETLQVEHWAETRVEKIDRADKRIVCDDGRTADYDLLFLTTGSRARVPQWYAPSDRMHLLRSVDDAARLRASIKAGERLIVMGGGWIGLEVAATARDLGADVVVLQATSSLCNRSVPPAVSDWLLDLHRARGVDVRTDVAVSSATDLGDGVAVTLADGTKIHGAALLIGIGAEPEIELAEIAGLACDNGIAVDATGRSEDPAIFAAGDVTSFPCSYVQGQVRRESWANAQNQAIVAAKAALGHEVRYDELPWLWSDQFGHNIQMAGLPERAAHVYRRRGLKEGQQCWASLDDDMRLTGVVTVDAPREMRTLRRLLQTRAGELEDIAAWEQA